MSFGKLKSTRKKEIKFSFVSSTIYECKMTIHYIICTAYIIFNTCKLISYRNLGYHLHQLT